RGPAGPAVRAHPGPAPGLARPRPTRRRPHRRRGPRPRGPHAAHLSGPPPTGAEVRGPAPDRVVGSRRHRPDDGTALGPVLEREDHSIGTTARPGEQTDLGRSRPTPSPPRRGATAMPPGPRQML